MRGELRSNLVTKEQISLLASLSQPNILPINAGILLGLRIVTTKENHDNMFGINDTRHDLLTKLHLLFLCITYRFEPDS